MMARTVALPDIRFGFHCFFRGNFRNGVRRFLAAPEHFPKHTRDQPPCFFQVEQQADKSRYDGLPEQRTHAGINICQNQNGHETISELLAVKPRLQPFPCHDFVRNRCAMGMRRPMPKARGDTFSPGAAWRRLYSLNVTLLITSLTTAASNPSRMISSLPRFCTT